PCCQPPHPRPHSALPLFRRGIVGARPPPHHNHRKSPHGSDLTSQSNGISERPSRPSCPATCRPAHPTASTPTRRGRNLHRPTPLPRRVHPLTRVRSTEPARPHGARKLCFVFGRGSRRQPAALVSDRDDAALFPAIRILERYGSQNQAERAA